PAGLNGGSQGSTGNNGVNDPNLPACSDVIGLTKVACETYFRAAGCALLPLTCASAFIPGPLGILGLVGCGLGVYNCATGGDAFTGAAECGVGLVAEGPIGGAAGCAGFVVCNLIPILSPCDPNEIEGPLGYAEMQWVSNEETLDYTIYFENDPKLATTSAQNVRVTQKLSDKVNPSSFRLGKFGFGPFVFEVPENRATYTTRLDLPDSLGIDLQVSAGVDIINNEIFWNFQSIDPVTGLAPYDPLVGFLPINDSLGSGEGFVNYTIRPKEALSNGDTVTAQADIIFDINEPIITNTWMNLVDPIAPSSAIEAVRRTAQAHVVEISWQGQDNGLGSGLAFYELYVSENGKPFFLYASNIESNAFTFTGRTGGNYGFFVRAVDYVGNQEALKTEAEVSVELDQPEVEIEHFVLIDGSTGQPLASELNEGSVLELQQLPSLVNFEAKVPAELVGSVRFILWGLGANTQAVSTQSKAPFRMFGLNGGDILSPQLYRLLAIAYTEPGGEGLAVDTLEVNFEIRNRTPGNISRFLLVDADQDSVITALTDGAVVVVPQLSQRRLSIEAVTVPNPVGSVAFRMSGPVNHQHVENSSPYVLHGNRDLNYVGVILPSGLYQVQATPYSGVRTQGVVGTSLSIQFELLEGAETEETSMTVFPQRIPGACQSANYRGRF
ncbi:MAG: hypothetical protein HC880_10540, partial [Bacteroidia bacterium]|nr:hypothetical protein [Bacteroidia bacterium]